MNEPINNEAILNGLLRKMVRDEVHTKTGLYDLYRERFERPLIKETLVFYNYNQSKTSAKLGINRGTLRTKIKEYGL